MSRNLLWMHVHTSASLREALYEGISIVSRLCLEGGAHHLEVDAEADLDRGPRFKAG